MTRTQVSGVLLGVAVAALGLTAGGQELAPVAPESVGLSAARLSEATALLHQFVADRQIAGAVAAVARHGKLAYLEAAGVQDLETNTPMTGRSVFRIYSMSKAVTAVAVMMLQQEGSSGWTTRCRSTSRNSATFA